MALRVSTTGSDVNLTDLGIDIIHPTTNRDLSLEFTAFELKQSSQLTQAIQNGSLTVDDGAHFIAADDYDPDEVLLQDLNLRGDTKYISNDELASQGDILIKSGIFPLALNSTANASGNVYSPAARWITWELEIGDLVTIAGNAAAGDYTVGLITDQQNFTVSGTIPDSTGGTISVYHPHGSTRIGVDNTNFEYIQGDTLQEVLDSIDNQLGGEATSGITPNNHRTLDQLVHNIAEDSFTEITYSGIKPTSVIVYTDSDKGTKIREEQITYNGIRVSEVVTIQYDADGLEEERYTEGFNYSGIRVVSIDGDYE